jgi:hypothetical protein
MDAQDDFADKNASGKLILRKKLMLHLPSKTYARIIEFRRSNGMASTQESIRYLINSGLLEYESGGEFARRLTRIEDALQAKGVI